MRAAHSESLVSSKQAFTGFVEAADRGDPRQAFSLSWTLLAELAFKIVYTVSRPFSSDAVVTMPRGLFSMR